MTALAGPISEIELPAFKEGVHVHRRGDWWRLVLLLPQRGTARLSYDDEGRMQREHMTTEGLRCD
jgi:YD repeat-containing protein